MQGVTLHTNRAHKIIAYKSNVLCVCSHKFVDAQHSAALTIEKPSEPISTSSAYGRRTSQAETGPQNTKARELDSTIKSSLVTPPSANTSSSSWIKTNQKPGADNNTGMKNHNFD